MATVGLEGTYSNLENHPRVIGTRPIKQRKEKVAEPVVEEDNDDSGSETEMEDDESRRECRRQDMRKVQR